WLRLVSIKPPTPGAGNPKSPFISLPPLPRRFRTALCGNTRQVSIPMAEQQRTEKSIFLAAVEIESEPERAAYVEQACAGNPQLRAEVNALLRAHANAQPLLDAPPTPGRTIDEQIAEAPGTVTGTYKLIEQIGEGGMGTVWMAQQTEPVKRLVALKLIKAGMGSTQVIARFEAERQALALMDHANIARVLDAGTTSAGRPYFVMD